MMNRYCFRARVRDKQMGTVVYDCSWPAEHRQAALLELLNEYGDDLMGFEYTGCFHEARIQ